MPEIGGWWPGGKYEDLSMRIFAVFLALTTTTAKQGDNTDETLGLVESGAARYRPAVVTGGDVCGRVRT